MHNLAFKRDPVEKVFPKPIPNYQIVSQPDGSSVVVDVVNPYDGLSSESFTLSAQIEAGVPLQQAPKPSSGTIDIIDVNNYNASAFVQKQKSSSKK